MKPKEGMFCSTSVSYVYSTDYSNSKHYLEGYGARRWNDLAERFTENYQFALLRGMTIVGVTCYKWDDVFYAVYEERQPFEGLTKLYLQGQLPADWRIFAQKLALEFSYLLKYPAYEPKWLLPYGYTQQQYLEDLAVYWDDISDVYWQLWKGSLFGLDVGPATRLRKLREQAQQEIDLITDYAGYYLDDGTTDDMDDYEDYEDKEYEFT